MDDLISRQRLLKELKHHKELFCRNRIQFLGLSKNDKARVDEIDNCYAMVINAPSAQPEIIRCKDCENWIPGYITDNDDFIPPKCGKYQQMVGHNSDDYCSHAERRTDDLQ